MATPTITADTVMEVLPLLMGERTLVGRCGVVPGPADAYDVMIGMRHPEGSICDTLIASVPDAATAVEITRRVNILTGNLR